MTIQIAIVLALTFVIYLIGTLSSSVRVVGVRTGKITIAFAIFNIFALVSRTANAFQAPLLAKTIETSIKLGTSSGLLHIFRWIIIATSIATVAGALLFPTFINVFTRVVERFSIYKSIPKLILHGFSKSGIRQFKDSISVPRKHNISQLKNVRRMPKKIIVLNIFASSILNVGVLASLYAGCLSPEYRTTCSTLSSVVNGIATIMMFVLIDPYISIMTDDVMNGDCSESDFKRCISFIVFGNFIGTILAQFLLVPAARVIEIIAQVI